MHTTRFWNSHHQVRSKPKIWNSNIKNVSFKSLGARKPQELNKVTIILIMPTMSERGEPSFQYFHLSNSGICQYIYMIVCIVKWPDVVSDIVELTYSYVLNNQERTECIPCNSNYSLKRVLVDCVDVVDVR